MAVLVILSSSFIRSIVSKANETLKDNTIPENSIFLYQNEYPLPIKVHFLISKMEIIALLMFQC